MRLCDGTYSYTISTTQVIVSIQISSFFQFQQNLSTHSHEEITMLSVGFLTTLCYFALLTAQSPWNHNKIIACPIITESVLNSIKSTFKNEEWSLCTRLTIYDDGLLLNRTGKTNSKVIKVKCLIMIFLLSKRCHSL